MSGRDAIQWLDEQPPLDESAYIDYLRQLTLDHLTENERMASPEEPPPPRWQAMECFLLGIVLFLVGLGCLAVTYMALTGEMLK